MKICFISPSLETVGGQERVTILLANALSEFQNIEVSIAFTTGDNEVSKFPYEIASKIQLKWDERIKKRKLDYVYSKVYRVLYKQGFIPRKKDINRHMEKIISSSERNNFTDFINENNFDIVIAVGPHASGVLGLCDNIKAKKIGWMHSSYARYFETYKDYLWNQGEIYSTAFEGLDRLIVLTHSAATIYETKTNVKVQSIPNPLPLEESKYKFNGQKTLLFVGRLVTEVKGIDILLNSIEILKNISDHNFKVLIVGDGPDKEKIEQIINNKELTNIVNMVGPTIEVEKYYDISDILLVPSRIEGFGLVVIEGMAHSLPVISYKTEGPLELIDDGENGYLIDKFDEYEFSKKVEILLDDLEKRSEMSRKAYIHSKSFSKEMIAEKWLELFNKLA